MSTVTISKKEYEKLMEAKFRYEMLREAMEGNIFSTPPTHSKKSILADFRGTKKYSASFLRALREGLARSDFFRV